MSDETASKWRGRIGWILGGSLGLLLMCAAGCGGLLYWVDGWLQEEIRETVFTRTCAEDVVLSVDYVARRNNLAGVTTNRRLEARYGAQRYGAGVFPLDGKAFPEFYDWGAPEHESHGEASAALNVFLRVPGVDRGQARAIERCIERDADELLDAIDGSEMPAPAPALTSWSGRRRVYWWAEADDLVPVFHDGDRHLSLGRDGSLTLAEPFASGGVVTSALGYVRGPAGDRRIEWTFQELSDTELARFLDAEGQTLPQRLQLAAP